MRGLRDAGHAPSLILTPNSYAVWSRLSANSEELEQDRLRLREAGVPEELLRFIRGRIEEAVVISVPGLARMPSWSWIRDEFWPFPARTAAAISWT